MTDSMLKRSAGLKRFTAGAAARKSALVRRGRRFTPRTVESPWT